MVKNLPAMQKTWVLSLGGEDPLEGEMFKVLIMLVQMSMGFPGGSDSKESACNAEDLGSIPGSGRTPGEGNGYPLQ